MAGLAVTVTAPPPVVVLLYVVVVAVSGRSVHVAIYVAGLAEL